MPPIPAEILDLIARGATFIINHSGGKDSQAQTIFLRQIVPAAQLVVVHAELPEVDWDGIKEHIEATVGGLPVHYCTAASTFFGMVERRGMFPSPTNRQCTSDLKRTPIERTIRAIAKATGQTLFVDCVGLRAEESTPRANAKVFRFDAKNSKAGREIYTWLPIHHWTTTQVFAAIELAGQQPHWAYAAGMTRLSCCFCIMSSKGDIKTAARLRPALLARIAATERRLGRAMMMPAKGGPRRYLDEIAAAA
jgi:3'-phosphoadenosine 5'-phosphosulfate sulfotransferase (PAPS reductase)/FAD synthetase